MKFAKLFEVGDSQVLVTRTTSDESESSLTVITEHDNIEIKAEFELCDIDNQSEVFEMMNQEKAESFRGDMIQGFLK